MIKGASIMIFLAALPFLSPTEAGASPKKSGTFEGKTVQLARPTAKLKSLSKMHRRGENIQRELIRILSEMLPGGYFTTKSAEAKPVRIEKDVSGEGEWLHLRAADPSTFQRHLFGGGHYRKQARFNLRAAAHAAEHSPITRFEFNGRRLFITQRRNEVGRRYDRGSKYQDFAATFDVDGRLTSYLIGSRGPWWTFSAEKFEVLLDGTPIRTADWSFIYGSADPHNGTTLFLP